MAELSTLDKAILHLSGASSMEELSETEIERYHNLSENPININYLSVTGLRSSGLFSDYQVESLADYRMSSGDILSVSELALLDGFSALDAEALSHFLNFEGSPELGSKPRYHHSLTIAGRAIIAAGSEISDKIKYRAEFGDIAEISWNAGKSISMAYYPERYLNKIILGNFSARFGQGLTAWSGFQLSGYSSVSSFSKKATGVSVTASSSPEYFGLASEWSIGRYELSLAYSIKDQRPLVNLRRYFRNLSLGLSYNKNQIGFDYRLALPEMSIFGEISSGFNLATAALAGLNFVPEYRRKYALILRYYTPKYKKYSGIAFGMERKNLTGTVDIAHRSDKNISQIKSLILYSPEYDLGPLSMKSALRHAFRYRPQDKYRYRNEIRLDTQGSYKSWSFDSRFNILWSKQRGLLYYVQSARSTESIVAALRLTLYDIPYWEDRIYVYQQDAPGNFNVPAYYGRGWAVSLYSAWHINRQHSLWLRCEYKSRWEIKLQYRWKI